LYRVRADLLIAACNKAAYDASMSAPRLVDAPSLPAYDLGQDHVFARDRQKPLFDLLHASHLVQPADFLPVEPATEDELALVHDRAYIAMLHATSQQHVDRELLRRAPLFGLGTADNPIAPGQHEAAAAAAGATLACTRAVLEGRASAAFNSTGGLHHAMPHGAAGFCLYNDLAIAIADARRRGAARVLYVDFDVHHGDGVEYAFRADPTVLTISFHETPEVRFPFTGAVEDRGEGPGRGYAINVPLHPGTDDASWLEAVERVLVPAARAFGPDLIVSQHGCDTHREDPLATLECTTRSMHRAAEVTRDLALEVCQGRWVATGGGGYQPYRVIPRAWSMVWSVMSGRPLPPRIDLGWQERWERAAHGELPTEWYDHEEHAARHEHAAETNRTVVDHVLAGIPWLRGRTR
jgi:acetoin utilization protein AcuC